MYGITDGIGGITGDISDMVAVWGEYLDCIRIVFIGWFCFEDSFELTKIVVDKNAIAITIIITKNIIAFTL